MANNNNNINGTMPNGTGTKTYTLHVTNLPLVLEKDGVKDMFTEFGEVTGMIIFKARNNTNQAFISYSKYTEAEQAIKELNETSPLMLTVRFKDSHKIESPVIDLSHPIHDFRYSDDYIDHLSCTKKFINIGKPNCTPSFQPNTYTSDDDLLYPVPNDAVTFNPYEIQEQYRDTNLMYTRGIAHVSKDGRRHVSFGRGYTYYHLPEPHYNIAAYLQNVHEKREKGIYEYSTEDIHDDTGFCHICSSPTPFRCQKCGITFYCSKSCQVGDWPKHKQECQPIPPLIKKIANKSPAQNQHIVEPIEKMSEIQGSMQLRRPKTAAPQNQQPQTPSSPAVHQNGDITTPTRENFRPKLTSPISAKQETANISGPRSPAISTKSTGSHHSSNDKQNSFNKQSTVVTTFKADATSFPIKKESQQSDSRQHIQLKLQQPKITRKSTDDNMVFQSNTFLPKDKFVQVRITNTLENGDYWVQKCEDDETLANFFIDLKKYADSSKRMPPEENVKCILETDSMWYRATIISLNKVSKIFYHDWGTYEEHEVREVCPINGFESMPSFCRQIHLADDTSNKYKGLDVDTLLSVKALNVLANGTIVVQVQPTETDSSIKADKITDKMANCSLQENTIASLYQKALAKVSDRPNVMTFLKIGESGFLVLNAELSENVYNVTLVPENQYENFGDLIENMKVSCDDLLIKNPHFKPNIGDLVCSSNVEGEWFRGVVLEMKPVIKVASIDEGRVFVPVNCTPIPEKFIDICNLGSIVKFQPGFKMPEPRPTSLGYSVIELLGSSKDSALIKLSSDEVKVDGNAIVSKWIPKSEQKGILYAPLLSGQEVFLTHFSSQALLYARNVSASEKERIHRLDQDVAKHALNRKRLNTSPVIGQMVLAYYEIDENYYRAIVTAIEGSDVIIKYIDYGNDETININKLYELPDELKEQPSSVVKIKLKGVPENVPLTKEATDYFHQLIGEAAILKCTFTEDPAKDGVILKTERNENVNDTVTNYLKPTWEKGVDDNLKVYNMSDLPVSKLGNVGDEVTAIVLQYYLENGTIILGANDAVLATAVLEEMLESINKYAKKTEHHYIPRDNELCIAKYEGVFYRALCLITSATPTHSSLFFIDYGNTELVAHTDIRIFVEDFATFSPYAVLCQLKPMIPDEKLTTKVSERINQLAVQNEQIKIKIISMDDDDTPNIDIPDIRVKLIEEGLL